METKSLRADRIGIAAASFIAAIFSSYFALEASDVVPNLFSPDSPLLASVFSESKSAHVDVVADAWAKALGFTAAVGSSLATLHRNARASGAVRIAYLLSASAFPLALVIVTMVIQPFFCGGFCIPCLVTMVFALAMIELRRSGTPDLDELEVRPIARGTNRRSSPEALGRTRGEGLGRGDATAE